MDGNLYVLQYGSYINKMVMEENVQKLENYFTYTRDGKYYVIVGASTFYENALLLSQKLEEEGIYTYIKNDYISNKDLINKIEIIDKEIIKNNQVIIEKNKDILFLLEKNYS